MIRTIYSVRRHEEKQEGKCVDALTEQGKINAVNIGKSLIELVQIKHSPLIRARETAIGIATGFNPENPPDIYESLLLVEAYPAIPKEMIRKDENGVTVNRDEIIDFWLKNCYMHNKEQSMYISGVDIIHLINIEIGVHLQKDGRIENITHAPNIESALITLVDPRMRIKDIGGSFKPGENFEIVVDYKNNIETKLIEVRYRGVSKPVRLERIYEIISKQ